MTLFYIFTIYILVYVFLGSPKALVDMMNAMHSLQLFENGDYMVIYVDTLINDFKDAYEYLWSNLTLIMLKHQ